MDGCRKHGKGFVYFHIRFGSKGNNVRPAQSFLSLTFSLDP